MSSLPPPPPRSLTQLLLSSLLSFWLSRSSLSGVSTWHRKYYVTNNDFGEKSPTLTLTFFASFGD